MPELTDEFVATIFDQPLDNLDAGHDDVRPDPDTLTQKDDTDKGAPSDKDKDDTSLKANESNNDAEEKSYQDKLTELKKSDPKAAELAEEAYKLFQSGATKKFMAAAEKEKAAQAILDREKQLEGLDPIQLERARHLSSVQDPAERAAWVKYYADWDANALQQPGEEPQDTANLPQWALNKLNQVDLIIKQQQVEKTKSEVINVFSALEKQEGEIPDEKKIEVLKVLDARNMGVEDIPFVYKALFYDEAMKRGIEKGHNLRQSKEEGNTPPVLTGPRTSSKEPDGPYNEDSFKLDMSRLFANVKR